MKWKNCIRYYGVAVRKRLANRSKFWDAVQTLNMLQSNAETLAKISKTRDSRRHLNIPHMINYLKRCDIELADLSKLSVIHISGTKGKGSTSAFCESILHHHGYKTGMFSSPHLVTVNERFRLNGRPIAKDLFSKYFWEVYNKLETSKMAVSAADDPDNEMKQMPAYFSFLTVMAFNIFLKEKVDVAILEVGIGGEYDCTNVIQTPVVCGITSLGLDHTAVLGDTIDKIAWQKAGIFKNNVPAVTVDQPSIAMDMLRSRAKEKRATLYKAPPLDSYASGEPLILGIAGSMQKHNATLALQLCRIWLNNHGKDLSKRRWISDQTDVSSGDRIPSLDGFTVSEEMKQGLSQCYWPGRNHVLRHTGVTYYLDGAHTLESIQQCAEWFQLESAKEASLHKGRICKVLVFNATKDRNSEALLSVLKPVSFDASVFCPNLAFTGNVTNTPDLINRTITKEKQLNFSLANKEIWDRLSTAKSSAQSCYKPRDTDFTHVITDPSVTNGCHMDLNQNNCSSSHQPAMKPVESQAFPCILQALYWASQGKDSVLELTDTSDIPPISDFLSGCSHIQVLVTGSLHLVGGALSLLNPELW